MPAEAIFISVLHGRRVGEVGFWILWFFNFLQFAIDWKNNSKTKVEKFLLSFIFMSSYAEIKFLKEKIT
jgi:hypothetical protein